VNDVVSLAERQLTAYNSADLDAFCECYSEDVVVLDERGRVLVEGLAAFRARYVELFDTCRDVHAEVDQRLASGRHCVDREHWSRVRRDTGESLAGEVLVRYTERQGRIAIVEFLR